MTSRQRVRYLWLPALVLLVALMIWRHEPPYRGPVHVINSSEHVG